MKLSDIYNSICIDMVLLWKIKIVFYLKLYVTYIIHFEKKAAHATSKKFRQVTLLLVVFILMRQKMLYKYIFH